MRERILSVNEMMAAIAVTSSPFTVGDYYAAALHDVLGVAADDKAMGEWLAMLGDFMGVDMSAPADPDDRHQFDQARKRLAAFLSGRG